MDDVLQVAAQMQKAAWTVIEETKVMDHWASIGATVNLVGSLKTGLLVNHRDIDFHIYKAVIADGVRDVEAFGQWKKQNPGEGIITWVP